MVRSGSGPVPGPVDAACEPIPPRRRRRRPAATGTADRRPHPQGSAHAGALPEAPGQACAARPTAGAVASGDGAVEKGRMVPLE
jgi:hypothetical protein